LHSFRQASTAQPTPTRGCAARGRRHPGWCIGIALLGWVKTNGKDVQPKIIKTNKYRQQLQPRALLGDAVPPVQVPLVPPVAAPPSPAAATDVVVSSTAAEPATPSLVAAARGVPAPPDSPSPVPDAPEQPESPPASSSPTPDATPPAAPPGHGMVTRRRDNTHREKTYTDGTVWYYPQQRALFAVPVSHHDALREPA
jgi:hypothetical protein